MIIVTGGAGFIGSVLLWQLNSQGIDEIVVVDNLGESEKWKNLVKRRYVEYLNRDRFHELLLRDALPWKVSALIHLGACSATTEKNCDFLMQNNFEYSRDVCRFCLDKGLRVIVASSAATYGDGRLGFSSDLDLIPHLRPLNMYAYSKQLLDLWLLREGAWEDVVSLKFFNVYGPNEYHKGSMRSVAVKACEEIQRTGCLSLFASGPDGPGNGEQKRDFVYVKDVSAIMAWLLERTDLTGIRNVGTGIARSFNELGRAVFSAMEREPVIHYIPMPSELVCSYQNYTCADMSWLEQEDCPVHFTPLERGVEDYVRNYLLGPDRYL